jgi:hypothetical protein
MRRGAAEVFSYVKIFGAAGRRKVGGAASQQVPDSLEQVRDLLKFLPYFFRRAAAPPLRRFCRYMSKTGVF